MGCCTAESRSPPPPGLWQRWVISTRNRPEHFSSAFCYRERTMAAAAAPPPGTPPWSRRGWEAQAGPPNRRSARSFPAGITAGVIARVFD